MGKIYIDMDDTIERKMRLFLAVKNESIKSFIEKSVNNQMKKDLDKNLKKTLSKL